MVTILHGSQYRKGDGLWVLMSVNASGREYEGPLEKICREEIGKKLKS